MLDFEPGWAPLVAAVAAAVAQRSPHDLRQRCRPAADHAESRAALVAPSPAGRFTTRFGRCDISRPLGDPTNFAVAEALACLGPPPVVVASYVVAENANALRVNDFAFFRGLAAAAPTGTVVLLAETTHRLWPEVLRAAYLGVHPGAAAGLGHAEAADAEGVARVAGGLQTELLRVTGKRGVALCLLKTASPPLAVPVHGAAAVGSPDWLEHQIGPENAGHLRQFALDNTSPQRAR